ncbi:MAG: 2-C-methyl-D-erythritol 4-phosphate cytidylyltransferase [Elusimicrobia bacterium]|nr:2-C-methyl-D-erythritol 4-phosphate cytidylyltransferase [Elusimicrobiota bacterium]
MRRTAFVALAAGLGTRFGDYKPAVRIHGRPMLYWSLLNLAKQRRWIDRVVIAVSSIARWRDLRDRGVVPEGFLWNPEIVVGGPTRFESLQRCLRRFQDTNDDWSLFVHDAARPVWPQAWIGRMLRQLMNNPRVSAVVPLLPVRETIKSVNGVVSTLDHRERLKISQTPQLIRLNHYLGALRRLRRRKNFLDESQVFELAGMDVLPYPGAANNIKVTYPEDLKLAAASCHPPAAS